jgi:hypothetical protein
MCKEKYEYGEDSALVRRTVLGGKWSWKGPGDWGSLELVEGKVRRQKPPHLLSSNRHQSSPSELAFSAMPNWQEGCASQQCSRLNLMARLVWLIAGPRRESPGI